MEEAPEVPTDDDQIRFCPKRSASSMDQDGPMAIGAETAGAICDEPQLVQTRGISVPA